MSLRLALTSDNLVVGRPGQNALVAAPNQRMFDGNYASPARFLRGQVADHYGGPGVRTTRINFGKSIPPAPFVMINFTATDQMTTPGGNGGLFAGEAFALHGFGGGQSIWNDFAWNWAVLSVTVTDSYMDCGFYLYGGIMQVSYVIDYLVFDYPLG